MTNLKEIYKCEICGNIVEVLHTGAGELVCCGQPMKLQLEKFKDEGNEKHVPVFEKEGNKITVKVGDVPHPMEETHFIEWIEVVFKSGKACKVFLSPSDEPKAFFESDEDVMQIREYCNLHGLWVNDIIKL